MSRKVITLGYLIPNRYTGERRDEYFMTGIKNDIKRYLGNFPNINIFYADEQYATLTKLSDELALFTIDVDTAFLNTRRVSVAMENLKAIPVFRIEYDLREECIELANKDRFPLNSSSKCIKRTKPEAHGVRWYCQTYRIFSGLNCDL